MANLKERLRAKFSRRDSGTSSLGSSKSVEDHGQAAAAARKKDSTRSLKSRGSVHPPSTFGSSTIDEKDVVEVPEPPLSTEEPKSNLVTRNADGAQTTDRHQGSNDRQEEPQPQPQPQPQPTSTSTSTSTSDFAPKPDDDQLLGINSITSDKHDSTSTADFPTPKTGEFSPVLEETESAVLNSENNFEIQLSAPTPDSISTRSTKPELSRRQSLVPHQQTRLIKTLLETELPAQPQVAAQDYFASNGPSTISANMVSRKIWVKRPGASATLVTINEDDLVDDVRDMILKKYANSLGRNFDSPDVTLRIVPRENRQERTLGPEEPMGRTLDAYFPGGQTVDEALVIDVPLRRTPKPSPRTHYYDDRPLEVAGDYFPPMPVAPTMPSPLLPNALPLNGHGIHHPPLATHSMSILTTGQVPNLPSPGSASASARRHHSNRPRMGRTHTSSPTVASGNSQALPPQHNGMHAYPLRHPRSRTHSSASEKSIAAGAAPIAPPLPTPPAASQNDVNSQIQRVATPPPRVSSPRPQRVKKPKKAEHPSLPSGMLNGAVPPINVLIVEDNIINLKLLEAFMKRLKVRWQTAMNGREAVTKWRAGGFHLVLMDIQLPIMSGLEATKEIRRLERLNSIGVFSSSASSSAPSGKEGEEPEGEDKLPSSVLFKSPVIIVALTASSLQSDRHEALAAGCNDFLTKPVNFVWLERKVMEWGCMQALIDFDGWRKWKDFSQAGGAGADDEKKKVAAKKKKDRRSLGSNPGAGSSRVAIPEEAE